MREMVCSFLSQGSILDFGKICFCCALLYFFAVWRDLSRGSWAGCRGRILGRRNCLSWSVPCRRGFGSLAGKKGEQDGKGDERIERRNAGLVWLKKGYAGSYTVEMAYVMAVFCLVMVVLIQQAYRLHDETKSGMELQEAVEMVRHDEDDRAQELAQEVDERAGLLFSMDSTGLQIEKGVGQVNGEICGERQGGPWGLKITSGIYEPEEFLRKIAALKQLEERYESQLQEGDAP